VLLVFRSDISINPEVLEDKIDQLSGLKFEFSILTRSIQRNFNEDGKAFFQQSAQQVLQVSLKNFSGSFDVFTPLFKVGAFKNILSSWLF